MAIFNLLWKLEGSKVEKQVELPTELGWHLFALGELLVTGSRYMHSRQFRFKYVICSLEYFLKVFSLQRSMRGGTIDKSGRVYAPIGSGAWIVLAGLMV